MPTSTSRWTPWWPGGWRTLAIQRNSTSKARRRRVEPESTRRGPVVIAAHDSRFEQETTPLNRHSAAPAPPTGALAPSLCLARGLPGAFRARSVRRLRAQMTSRWHRARGLHLRTIRGHGDVPGRPIVRRPTQLGTVAEPAPTAGPAPFRVRHPGRFPSRQRMLSAIARKPRESAWIRNSWSTAPRCCHRRGSNRYAQRSCPGSRSTSVSCSTCCPAIGRSSLFGSERPSWPGVPSLSYYYSSFSEDDVGAGGEPLEDEHLSPVSNADRRPDTPELGLPG
jgi:hypothetical protein